MMVLHDIQRELDQIARDLKLSQPEVRAEQSGRWFHVLIVSEDFRGKSSGERDNLIWREFERRFDDSTILAITQCYLLTPDELQEIALDVK